VDSVKQYPEYILKKLRQRQGLIESDKSHDDQLNKMSPDEVFEECLEWEGLINYHYILKNWTKDIYGVDLDNING